jgi:hypothetical protein
MRALRIALLGALLTVALAANALAATVIHFERESLPALTVQLGKHEVHALTFHPTPEPGHVHISMNDGRHYTVAYTAGEQPHIVALGRAAGTPITIATVQPKAAKPAHHTLRYVAGGILIVVIVVVLAVLLVDRRRKLNAGGPGTTPAPGDSAT